MARDGAWRDAGTMRELYVEEGRTVAETADRVGCATATARRWLKKHDIETREGGHENVEELRDKSLLYELYWGELLTAPEIAERLDCGTTSVQRWMNKHGIPIRNGGPLCQEPLLFNPSWLRKQYWENGLSWQEIADALSVSYGTVQNAMNRHGIESHSQGDDRLKDADWLKQQYSESGKTGYEIAQQLGVSYNTVYEWLEKHGIDKRDPHAKGADNPRFEGGTRYYGPNWDEQREKRIEYDDHECQRCGMARDKHREEFRGDIHVHHIKPKNEFLDGDELDWEEANVMSNLITLCRDCHCIMEGLPIQTDSP